MLVAPHDIYPSAYIVGMGAGASEWSSLTKWVLGVTGVAGTVGVGLQVAGLHSATGSALVLLFMAEVPTVAFAGLLRSFDPFGRFIIACSTNLAIVALMAMVMAAEGVWSPTGELLAVAGITALCFVAQLAPVRERVTTTATSWRQALPDLVTHTRDFVSARFVERFPSEAAAKPDPSASYACGAPWGNGLLDGAVSTTAAAVVSRIKERKQTVSAAVSQANGAEGLGILVNGEERVIEDFGRGDLSLLERNHVKTRGPFGKFLVTPNGHVPPPPQRAEGAEKCEAEPMDAPRRTLVHSALHIPSKGEHRNGKAQVHWSARSGTDRHLRRTAAWLLEREYR